MNIGCAALFDFKETKSLCADQGAMWTITCHLISGKYTQCFLSGQAKIPGCTRLWKVKNDYLREIK